MKFRLIYDPGPDFRWLHSGRDTIDASKGEWYVWGWGNNDWGFRRFTAHEFQSFMLRWVK